MLPKILIAAAAVFSAFALFIATRPPAFRIERSILIAAPPERAFRQVNDFHAWRGWSPYERLDVDLRRDYAGPLSGVGASYSWAGKKAGEGTMTIEESVPASRIAIRLDFRKPMAATHRATFTFAQAAGGTRVTWAIEGRCNLIQRAVGTVVDMDALIGREFERGLEALRNLAEAPPFAAAR